jgi:hypothetical protein
MAKLNSDILIRRYYEEVKHLYPHVTYDEFKEICRSPFEYTKQEISSGDFPVIRLKYLGTFLVYPKKAQAFLNRLKQRFKFHKVDRMYYFKMKEKIETYLNSHG